MTVQELINELEKIPKQSRHRPIIMTEYDGEWGVLSTYTVDYIYNNQGVYELKKKFIKSQSVEDRSYIEFIDKDGNITYY